MNEEVELWKEVYDFPLYEISSFGRVRNRSSGHILKPAINQSGVYIVGLRAMGKTYMRGLAKLVANAFLEDVEEYLGVSAFDHVLHLDHDRSNCRASNLLYRPRWWVIKWEQEWRDGPTWRTRVIHAPSATIFETPWHAAHASGMLENSIHGRCVHSMNYPDHPTDWSFYAE